MATANALKPTTGATLLNYLHFPQALMIPPFSVLYLTVVYRTASCGLLSFFQVWRLAFEVRSKILLFKDTGPVDSKRVCYLAHDTVFHASSHFSTWQWRKEM